MSESIKSLEPKELWSFFYDLTQIPRPSGKEQGVIEYLKKFGREHGLETIVDEVGNVIIRKPATPGMENRKGVILQGHMDMVPQANSDSTHNFETDPIQPRIDGEWVKATGTTLGADNGIGVAAALTVLASKEIPHGMVEGLFTVDEETGMTGAFNMKPGVLKGDILLNMDSEDEGEMYVGCAGGTNANVQLDFTREPVPDGMKSVKLTVSGLKGGHSGIDIPLERGNANKILFRAIFEAMNQMDIRLSQIEGGSLRNAIPRESYAVIYLSEEDRASFTQVIDEVQKAVKQELSGADPDVLLAVTDSEDTGWIMDRDAGGRLVKSIYACPNGVIRMSTDMPGLVETSTNLAIVKTDSDQVGVKCLLRSSVDSAKDDLKNAFTALFQLAGARIDFDGEYPGWKPNMDSPILKTGLEVYHSLFNKTPEIKAIHAGLECGLLGGTYPNWDMISFGPTIRFPHSPDEKVNIETVQKFFGFLLELLKSVPEK